MESSTRRIPAVSRIFRLALCQGRRLFAATAIGVLILAGVSAHASVRLQGDALMHGSQLFLDVVSAGLGAVADSGTGPILAQLTGRERRPDRRDSRQDCRSDESALGQDKRNCKDDRRDERDDEAEAQASQGSFEESCHTMGGSFATVSDGYECRYPDGSARVCDADGQCKNVGAN